MAAMKKPMMPISGTISQVGIPDMMAGDATPQPVMIPTRGFFLDLPTIRLTTGVAAAIASLLAPKHHRLMSQ
jgi:hypothetical protein